MILLETNVLSELMKPTPDAGVMDWISARPATTMYTSSITQAEILHGVMLLPSGKRPSAFEAAAEAMFRAGFSRSAVTPHRSMPRSPLPAGGRAVRYPISMHRSRPSPGRPGQRSQLETSRTSKVAA